MLVGPILDGALFKFGGIQLGSIIAVLLVLVALLTLCPTMLVEHDRAKSVSQGSSFL